jgi:hypothetical protein
VTALGNGFETARRCGCSSATRSGSARCAYAA